MVKHLLLLMFAAAVHAHLDNGSPTTVVARNANPDRIESAASLSMPTFSVEVSEDDRKNASTAAYFWAYHDCDDGQKTAIQGGLAEAHTVLDNHWTRVLDIHWNDFATVEYLSSPWFLTGIKRDLQAQYDRAKNFKDTWWSYNNVEIFCSKETRWPCLGDTEPSYIYVDNSDAGKKNLKVYFCGRYFDLGSLQPIMERGMASPLARDLTNYENRARAWMTAIFRLSYVARMDYQEILHPRTKRNVKVDSPSECKYLAKNERSTRYQQRASRSPSNWAWWAMAQFVTVTTGNYPHEPVTPKDLRSR